MRLLPFWILASLAVIALGCQQAGTFVSTAGATAPTPPVPVPRTPAPTAPGATIPEVTTVQHEWLAFGDSITQDAFAVNLAWQDRLGTQGPVPVNAGVRGDTTTNALARVD